MFIKSLCRKFAVHFTLAEVLDTKKQKESHLQLIVIYFDNHAKNTHFPYPCDGNWIYTRYAFENIAIRHRLGHLIGR